MPEVSVVAGKGGAQHRRRNVLPLLTVRPCLGDSAAEAGARAFRRSTADEGGMIRCAPADASAGGDPTPARRYPENVTEGHSSGAA